MSLPSLRRTRAGLAGVLLRAGWLPVAISAVTLIVFSPTLRNGFVDWDDQINVLQNPYYRGLGWAQLRWMFTSVLMGHWIPVTWMSLGLDYVLWGMKPFGYHLTNVLLHAANAALFYLVGLRLIGLASPGLGPTGLRAGAAAAALFFALHPLRAESVAWVTERRDVLSGFFFLLTILMYLKAGEAPGGARRRWLALSVALYALALASKSIVMTLPLVLIVLDAYPLRRLGGGWRAWIGPAARRVWLEKVPYFLLAGAGGAVSFYAVSANEYLTRLEQYPLPARVAMAFYSFWFYVWKTVLPVGLSPLHELPARVNPLEPRFLLSALGVGAVTALVLLLRRRWPAGLAVWAAYLVMLGPVSGFIHAGHQLAHDRYSYLSCLGWALLVGGGVGAVARLAASGSLRPAVVRLAAGAGVVWFLGLGALTWSQVQVWRDSDTLWRYALESDPDCSICHANLAVDLVNRGYAAPAIEHFQKTLALRPDRLKSHGGLGLAFLNTGRLEEAVEQLRRSLEWYPNDLDVRNHLGAALLQQRKFQEGIEQVQKVLQVNPSYAPALTNLGAGLIEQGRPAEAVPHLRRAVELMPEVALPRLVLARAYRALGEVKAAEAEQEAVERLNGRRAQSVSWAIAP